MRTACIFILVLCSLPGFAQNGDLPTDFLSSQFHKERREEVREKLPANSVAVFFANPVRNRANDVDYVYHQDPDFFYLTGYKEPNALLFVFKDQQKAANGESYNEILFVQPRDAMQELWTGRRLGAAGTKERLGFTQAFDNGEFKKYNLDFSKFEQILFFDFQNDVRDDTEDPSDLFNLIQEFKQKVNYPAQSTTVVTREPEKNNLNTRDLAGIMDELRVIKTAEELEIIRKAVRISCAGQTEVMKAMRPGMSEREIQGIFEYVFKKYQAEDVGYPSIVGGGHNGCILHYIDNYKPNITSRELVLMDLGAEYHGYTADITRTVPAGGKFSTEQKQVYNLVLKAQEEAKKICKPGITFQQLNDITRQVVNRGLADLGIIKNEKQENLYYPHGCCHYIGLDVHDRGTRDVLRENMVITIEPGIYIPDNADCDKRWWGIAVRIEDDFLLTSNGCELLSSAAPRTTEEIEETMKMASPLDDFVLPDIDTKNK
jgi:Xaa-Pro aminopeptidase